MYILLELFQTIGLGLAMLLPLANPITAVAVLLSLSQGMTSQQIKHEIMLAAIYTFAIMMVAYYGGQLVMTTFGISIPGLRIAGGLIVVFIGFQMLFPAREVGHAIAKASADDIYSNNKESIAFVPLAMPSTAGPGTIALIISSASTVATHNTFSPLVLTIAPTCIFLIISLLLWVCLRSANSIMSKIGKGGVDTIARLMGFLLVCMGVQFIINGVFELITTYQ